MLKKITLKFTEQPDIDLPASGAIIFVGPNSSGKSLVLKEIEEAFRHNQLPANLKILRDFELAWPTLSGAITEVKDLSQRITQPAHYTEGTYKIGGFTPAHGFQEIQVSNDHIRHFLAQKDKFWWASNILRWKVIRLDGRSRFALTDDVSAGDLQMTSTNSLSHLFSNDEDRTKVQKVVLEAFGLYFVIDPTKLGTLRIRLSRVAPPLDEQSLNSAARSFHSSALHIKEASDGVQAFTGIVTTLLSGTYKVILIDEPEAFLHPPLARKLGKELATIASETDGALLASTHSSDFLLGCLHASKKVHVVRLEYSDGKSTARMVDPTELEEFLGRPLMRSSNVVSALFYDGVVVTESDNDRVFYSEIYYRLTKEDSSLPSILFVNAQNKQTAKDIVGPLRKFGVPSAAFLDIDFIKEGGKTWTDWLTAIRVPPAMHGGLAANRASIKAAFDKAGKDMKAGGVALLSESDAAAAEDFFDSLEAYGLFAVKNGELESWLPSLGVSGKKTDWTIAMLNRLGSSEEESTYVRPSNDDVWEKILSIVRWVRNPSRKGMA